MAKIKIWLTNKIWPAMVRRASILLLAPFAVILVLIMRALKPLILVRIGGLASSRIGNFSSNTEMYLCLRDENKNTKPTLDIFYCNLPVCNKQLEKMWRRTLRIWPFWLAYPLDKINLLLGGGAGHHIPTPLHRDVRGLFIRTKPHISFLPSEERFGQEELRRLGMPDDAPFVLVNARDSNYLDTLYSYNDWSYHSYRNARIQNYLKAAEELANRGYFVIRMGYLVKDPLPTGINPRIIDYATKFRTDFLDIYLSAKCHFYIGSLSGLDEVPTIFRRPIVFTNAIPFEIIHTWNPDFLTIPKKYRLRGRNSLMTFGEILASRLGQCYTTDQYKKFDVEIIENSPEEIAAAVIEMDERLKGTWRTTEEDEELQERFRGLFRSSKFHGKFVSRIGAEFLRRNKELLS